MHRIAIPQEFNTTLADGWLAEVPYIVERLPPSEHLPFLVRLFVALEKSGIPLEQHLECAIEGLILEESQ